MKLILPRTFVENSITEKFPLFFLAGPVQGGGNWQEECCIELAQRITSGFFVVVPCRWHSLDRLYGFRVSGLEEIFSSQTEWEHYYLNLANVRSRTHQGCIIFWLPRESRKSPRGDGQPYARDTYGELGRWGRSAALSGARVIVGAETDFPGLSSIQKNLNLDANGSQITIWPTLAETVEQAVHFVKTERKE